MNAARSITWHERRQALLHAACNAIAALRQDQVPISRAIKLVARKFRNRSLGGGHRLRLSRKTMRRHWDRWNKAENPDQTVFRTRYKPGHPRAELNPAFLGLIAENCIRNGYPLGRVLRIVPPTAANGKRLSPRTIYRRVPAREIRKLGVAHRRLMKHARELEQEKSALAEKLLAQ